MFGGRLLLDQAQSNGLVPAPASTHLECGGRTATRGDGRAVLARRTWRPQSSVLSGRDAGCRECEGQATCRSWACSTRSDAERKSECGHVSICTKRLCLCDRSPLSNNPPHKSHAYSSALCVERHGSNRMHMRSLNHVLSAHKVLMFFFFAFTDMSLHPCLGT